MVILVSEIIINYTSVLNVCNGSWHSDQKLSATVYLWRVVYIKRTLAIMSIPAVPTPSHHPGAFDL